MTSALVIEEDPSGLPSFCSNKVAVLEAYCDETDSSAEGKRLLLLAGYAADAERWRAFGREWQSRVLHRYEIPFFHTKDLRSGNSRLYRHLSYHKRRSLAIDAATVISESGIEGTGIIFLRPSDWKSATTSQERCRWGTDYRIATDHMLIGFSTLFGSTEIGNEPLFSIFLEDGHPRAADAIKGIKQWTKSAMVEMPTCLSGMKLAGIRVDGEKTTTTSAYVSEWPNPRLRIEAYGLAKKQLVMPVQAADFLAYLSGAAIRKQIDKIFDGLIDKLMCGKYVSCQLGPRDIQLRTESLRNAEAQAKTMRSEREEKRRRLRGAGIIVHELPTGQLFLSPKDTDPKFLDTLSEQLADIRKRRNE